MEQTYSDTSAGNKIGVHKFLEALGLLDNEVVPVNMDALSRPGSSSTFYPFRLFIMCLPNFSEQAKNRLFVAFSRSNSFGVLEHNALLNALAHPVKGLNLFEYDELRFDLINNVKL
ncbi:23869_t:CDS:2 [Gigaspora rosea]|nr:23869_t:CDS:2 [Gigaspora rosea]